MKLKSSVHIKEAKLVLNSIVYISCTLSAISIVGGIIGIIWQAISPTEIQFFDIRITTGHVGVAFVALGLTTMLYTIKNVLKHLNKLAEIRDRE